MTPEQRQLVDSIRDRARRLFQGEQVAERSCGIALAEAFGLPTRPYQALCRGFVTGAGPCGAVTAGQLILGEYLGYGDASAPVSLQLREASERYQREILGRIDHPDSASLVCHDLLRRFPIDREEERAEFCAGVVAAVAELVGEILVEAGAALPTPDAA